MIEINLLPPEFRKKEIRQLKLPPLPNRRQFLLTLAGLLLIEASLLLVIFLKDTEVKRLTRERIGLNPQIAMIEAIKSDSAQMRSRLKVLEEMTTRPFYWTELLMGVSESVPEGLWLTEMKVISDAPAKGKKSKAAKAETAVLASSKKTDGKKAPAAKPAKEKEAAPKRERLIITGVAQAKSGGPAAVAEFIERLEDSAKFKKGIVKISLEKTGRQQFEDEQVYDFTVSCIFKSKRPTEAHAEQQTDKS